MDERKLLIAKALAARNRSQSSDSNLSSSESEGDALPRIKFVPRDQRMTASIAEAEAEAEAAEMRRIEQEAIRERQKQIALAEAKLDDSVAVNDQTALIAPSLGIEDSPEAFALWKIREMKRILKSSSSPETSREAKGVFFQ